MISLRLSERNGNPGKTTAIFDHEGTLAETLPLIYRAFNAAMQPVFGRKLADEEIRGMFGPPDTTILRFLVSADQAELAIERYMKAYNRDHIVL